MNGLPADSASGPDARSSSSSRERTALSTCAEGAEVVPWPKVAIMAAKTRAWTASDAATRNVNTGHGFDA